MLPVERIGVRVDHAQPLGCVSFLLPSKAKGPSASDTASIESCLAADRRQPPDLIFGHGIRAAALRRRSNPKPLVAGAAASRPRLPARRRSAAASHRPIPITVLIDASQQHFEAGERELKLGHLDSARVEFDRAVEVLLESPYGARTDARLREHFDRLVDRINAYEVTALAQGDGFAEKTYEPASIDELLKIATFPKPRAGADDREGRQGRPRRHRARHADPAERPRAGATSSCSRAGCATTSRRA